MVILMRFLEAEHGLARLKSPGPRALWGGPAMGFISRSLSSHREKAEVKKSPYPSGGVELEEK